jgi:hypothetical protein
MKPIRKVLNAPGLLSQLKKELTRQQTLTEQVRASLPPPLNEQLLGASLSGRRLSLWVNSPAWASRLRYMAPQLLRQLRKQGLAIEHLRPHIVPEKGVAKRSGSHRAAALSPNSARQLLRAAEALEPGPLQDALRRLSRHQR